MSIPGVETARRRRASHGRCCSPSLLYFSSSSASSSPYRIVKLLITDAAPSLGNDESEERNELRERALAARNRLDEKLKSGSLSRRAPSHYALRNREEPTDSHKRESTNNVLSARKERMHDLSPPSQPSPQSDDQQEDCPVCLDRFSGGQLIVCLPCVHKFHKDCLTPWLMMEHYFCPFCRGHIPAQESGYHTFLQPSSCT